MKITQYFVRHTVITNSQQELFLFAVEGLIYDMLITLLCISIGIHMEVLHENIVFLFSYSALHRCVNGIHATTRKKCIVCTCIICSISMMIIRDFPPQLTALFAIPSLWIFSQYAQCGSSLNPKTIHQEASNRLRLRKTIYFLYVSGVLSMLMQLPYIYVPIFTAFGIVSALVWGSLKNKTDKLSIQKLQFISGIILSMGVEMVQTSCPHWCYESPISDSLRRNTDNL